MLCLTIFLLTSVNAKVLFESPSLSANSLRISGGSESVPNQYPWMVKLGWKGMKNCGGALISDRHVLTAYHCVDEVTSWPGKQLKVGVHNQKDDSDYQLVQIETAVWPYEVFGNWSDWEMDIAIIILATPVDLSDKKISTIDLPSSQHEDYKGELATAMGWGLTHFNSSLESAKLKDVELTVSQKETENYLFTEVVLVNGEYQDPCSGDSGGPLVHRVSDAGRWTIIGTVSGGGYDCRDGQVYGKQKWNKVSTHLDWIMSVLGCTTMYVDEEAVAGSSCIFPFIYDGSVQKECSTLDDTKPWCATSTDNEGNMKEWGYCGPTCKKHTVPELISIRSTGGAAERTSQLGYYEKKGVINGQPRYTQRKSNSVVGGDTHMFYSGTRWLVSSKLGGSTGNLRSASTATTPPKKGWQYWDGDNWSSDSTLLLTHNPRDVNSCSTVRVSSSGATARRQSNSMGRYRFEGEWSSGRKIYQNKNGKYLLIQGSAIWGIRNSKNDDESSIASGRGTLCPCEPAAGPSDRFERSWWKYYGNDGWYTDSSIQLDCY